ncbi:MAG: nucleotide sugar dehydrogenase [bacterium]
MNISIFGLGYVGCVSAGALAYNGNKVIGVDISKTKIELINQGKPTIIEKDINALIKEGKERGLLEATMDAKYAVHNSEISIIAVGTPSSKEGHLNLQYIFKVAEQIGKALKSKKEFHIIAIRSTVLPGTNKKVGKLLSEYSGKRRGEDFAVVSNPEFLREGTAVKDYFNPPITLIGVENKLAEEKMVKLYNNLPAEIITTEIKVAEIMKYVNNTYHALKIVFANEVGNICKELNIDSHKVMDIFCKDKQLNISSYYFKPGFAYGGSCLPKDSKALRTLAKDLYIDVPVINNIENSNDLQKEKALELIMEKGKRNIGILGLSFKAGTDDLRNSPIVEVVERLLGKGYKLNIYDKNVKLSEISGTNKEYIENKIPHLQHFITNNLHKVINESDVIVVTNSEEEFKSVLTDYPNKIIIDLVRLWNDVNYKGLYDGIAWGDINKSRYKEVASTNGQ